MHKDFGLALAAAMHAGLSLPATEAAASVNAAETVNGEEDFSAVVRRMEQEVAAQISASPAA
jgi:3-hydroxyisobutyrate dehydrogenase-like beta-hydroxyacid dehydrogenase